MSDRVVVIPHGCGIGDFVNLQPLVRAIQRARPRSTVEVLGPRSHAVLLPAGVEVRESIEGMPYWRRLPSGAALRAAAPWVRSDTVGPLLAAVPRRRLADGLTWYLRRSGRGEVINLLADLSALDLDDRWTPGPWCRPGAHLIDLLAAALEKRGIAVPPTERQPSLHASTAFAARERVLLNVDAGSSLKTLPVQIWTQVAGLLLDRGIRCALVEPRSSPRARQILHEVPTLEALWTTDLTDLVDAIGSCEAMVSPDTGALHIASALDVHSVGLFGPTDPTLLGPYNREKVTVVRSTAMHGETCRRCWTAQLFADAACGMNYSGGCMGAIVPESIVDAVVEILAKAESRSRPDAEEGRIQPRHRSA